MKHLKSRKVFESDRDGSGYRLDQKVDISIYHDMVDICQELMDDGFTIRGLSPEIPNWLPNWQKRFLEEMHIEIFKTHKRKDNMLLDFLSDFKLGDVKDCIDHLISYMEEKGYEWNVGIRLPLCGYNDMEYAFLKDRLEIDGIKIEFEKEILNK